MELKSRICDCCQMPLSGMEQTREERKEEYGGDSPERELTNFIGKMTGMPADKSYKPSRPEVSVNVIVSMIRATKDPKRDLCETCREGLEDIISVFVKYRQKEANNLKNLI